MKIQKRITAFLSSMVLCIGAIFLTACGGNGDKGTGEAQTPYKISTVADLKKIAKRDTAGQKKYFVLMNDIDLKDKDFGGFSDFYGELDGQNYTIFNYEANDGEGIFYENHGTIKNLKVAGVNIYTSVSPVNTTSNVLGGLVNINKGTLVNCGIKNASVSISAAKQVGTKEELSVYAGGLVGLSSGVMRYCYAINSELSACGDIAPNDTASDGACRVCVGGLLGATTQYAILDSCYAYGNAVSVTARGGKTFSLKKAVLRAFAGGLVGDSASENIKRLFAYDCQVSTVCQSAGKSVTDNYPHGGIVIGACSYQCENIYALEGTAQAVIGGVYGTTKNVGKLGTLALLLEKEEMRLEMTNWQIDESNKIAFEEFLYAPILETVETEE